MIDDETELYALIERSYRAALGRELVGGDDVAARARFVFEDAPFGLLAHDATDDPHFVYANTTALGCFDASWSELVGLPSRLSALPSGQEDRDALLARVDTHGYAEGYRGLRVSRTGRRFWIEDVVMWNLVDRGGAHRGQAALFGSWSEA